MDDQYGLHWQLMNNIGHDETVTFTKEYHGVTMRRSRPVKGRLLVVSELINQQEQESCKFDLLGTNMYRQALLIRCTEPNPDGTAAPTHTKGLDDDASEA